MLIRMIMSDSDGDYKIDQTLKKWKRIMTTKTAQRAKDHDDDCC